MDRTVVAKAVCEAKGVAMSKRNALYWRRIGVQALIDTIPDYAEGATTRLTAECDHVGGSYEFSDGGERYLIEVRVFELKEDK